LLNKEHSNVTLSKVPLVKRFI